jgi:hypothetical protein
MNRLKKIIEEVWKPGEKWEQLLYDPKDTKNPQTVASYVEYYGMPEIVNDIWKYAKSKFGKYPNKIVHHKGIQYNSDNGGYVEITFKNGKPFIYHMSVNAGSSRGSIDYNVIESGKFSYSLFNKMMNK